MDSPGPSAHRKPPRSPATLASVACVRRAFVDIHTPCRVLHAQRRREVGTYRQIARASAAVATSPARLLRHRFATCASRSMCAQTAQCVANCVRLFTGRSNGCSRVRQLSAIGERELRALRWRNDRRVDERSPSFNCLDLLAAWHHLFVLTRILRSFVYCVRRIVRNDVSLPVLWMTLGVNFCIFALLPIRRLSSFCPPRLTQLSTGTCSAASSGRGVSLVYLLSLCNCRKLCKSTPTFRNVATIYD
jgi:hypothetical protein